MNSIDEIKKLKELLDVGAITPEEFDSLKLNILSSAKDSISSKSAKVKDIVTNDYNHKDKISQEEAFKMLRKMKIAYSRENLVIYSEEGNLNVVELLLIAGSNPNGAFINDQNRKCYALHYAALNGHIDVINLLLKKGAKVDLQDEFGYTAIFFAIENGKIDAVNVLIKNGADINIKTTEGANPIFWAKKFKKREIMDILNHAGAKELTNNQVSSLERPLFLKKLKLISIFVGLIFLVGWCVNSTPTSSNSSPDASSQYAELHCPWCQEVQKSNNGKGLVYYEWVDGGVSWNQFYDGIKYKCCSERCCRLFHSANKD